jgi:integrase
MTDPPGRRRVGERVTIYPRGRKQIWCADFWHDGRHGRQSLRTRDRKVALRRAVQLELDLAAGTFRQPPPPVTTRQAADDYLAFLRTEGRAPRTLVKYRGILAGLVAFLAGRHATRLAQFTPALFDRFGAQRRRGHHPRTMYTEGVVVKQFFKWAVSRRLLAENPVAPFRLVKPPLEPRGGPGRTAVAVLAFTGLRSGELQRLRPEDLDLAGNWLHVRSRPGAETKTRRSRRLPLPARLRPLLAALPARPRPWLFSTPPRGRASGGDGRLNVKRLNEAFLAALRRLGLPAGRAEGGFTLHALRHFFETFTVNAGIPQRVVDTWLGHGGDRSMASVYDKLSDEDSQAFMTRVPFGGARPAADAGQEV